MNQKILLVEDEPLIRWSLRKTLESNGYECLEAENGEKALNTFKNELPDLVLLDVNLPDMSGLDLISKFHHCEREIPIFVLSADSGNREKAIENGARHFFEKPVIFRNLLKAVQCLLIG